MSDNPASTPDAERLTLRRLEQLIEAADHFSCVNRLPLIYMAGQILHARHILSSLHARHILSLQR
jgi:hypothetical protein